MTLKPPPTVDSPNNRWIWQRRLKWTPKKTKAASNGSRRARVVRVQKLRGFTSGSPRREVEFKTLRSDMGKLYCAICYRKFTSANRRQRIRTEVATKTANGSRNSRGFAASTGYRTIERCPPRRRPRTTAPSPVSVRQRHGWSTSILWMWPIALARNGWAPDKTAPPTPRRSRTKY